MSFAALTFRIFAVIIALFIIPLSAQALDKITIGYFLGWPSPNLVAKQESVFTQEIGIEVDWKAFETSEDMVRAIDQNRIQVAFAMELIPFMRGLNRGVDMSATAVAVSYPDHQLCIVRKDGKLHTGNLSRLKGMTVATLPGSENHYKMEEILKYYGVDLNSIDFFPAADGATVAKALFKNKSNISCAYGGPLHTMSKIGRPLLTGEQQEALGLKTFDLVVMSQNLIKQHQDIAKIFLQINSRYNQRFLDMPNAMINVIAKQSGMDQRNAKAFLDMFAFRSVDAQKSNRWFGSEGIARQYSAGLGRFLVEHQKLERLPLNLDSRFDMTLL